MYNPSTGQVRTSPMMGVPAAGNQQYYPQQPFQVQSYGSQPWSTSLCDCSQDCGNCCMTCFCHCVTFGRIAEIVDKGSTSCGRRGALYALLQYTTCCHWICSCAYRSKLRAEYSLAEAPCGDCCVHFCCEPCALCQEYRELKNRGFDMTIGWRANMQRLVLAAAAKEPPAMQGGMHR